MKSISKLKAIPQLYSPFLINQSIKFAPKLVFNNKNVSQFKNIFDFAKNFIKTDSKINIK
jgi:hypothetical protein